MYVCGGGQIPERDYFGPPVIPGSQEIGGIPKPSPTPTGRAVSKERLDDWNGQIHGRALVPVPAGRATWPNGEWGYSTRCHMLDPERPEAVLPYRALYLPTSVTS